VVAGAGSSLEFGMPSVREVGELLRKGAQESFALAETPDENLYGHLCDKIAHYWREHLLRSTGPREPNFEDILYLLSSLTATYPAGVYTSALGAFVAPPTLPDILQSDNRRSVDANVVGELGRHLVDDLLTNFRDRCDNPTPSLAANRSDFQSFFVVLRNEFDMAVVTAKL